LIRGAIEKMGQGAGIVIATDNDEGGRALAEQIAAIAAETGRKDLKIVRDLPEGEGSDWNDRLRENPLPRVTP
jgi:DNA primase